MPIYNHDPVIHNFSAASEILPYVLKLKNINSVLDIGCGTGTWLYVAKELGLKETLGVDGVALDQSQLKIPISDFINHDLKKAIKLEKIFDLVICLEVAEHLPEAAAQTLIDTLTEHGDFILFSAAIPGQGGQNHLNEQWPEYWVSLFSNKGYVVCDVLRNKFWNNKKIEWWYKQNILIFGTQEMALSLNLPITGHADSLIHPELFNDKLTLINKQNALIQKEIWNPTFKKSVKNLFKSIFK